MVDEPLKICLDSFDVLEQALTNERLDNNTFLDSLIIEIEKGKDASYSLNIIYDSSLYSRKDIETYFSCASRL